uniref:WW domain-containing protein n=1 Tax=Ditylenchus dipsaci TaxID=166011 RepID=A0A915DMQ7_9BILA
MEGSSPKMVRLKEFGVWSEQTSSSGKRYYYNRESEISQWEKPIEWKEHEKALTAKQGAVKAVKTVSTATKSSITSQQQSTICRPVNNNHVASTSDITATSTTNTPTAANNQTASSISRQPQQHTSSKLPTNGPVSSTSTPLQHNHHNNRSNGSLKRGREEERHHHRHSQGSNSTPNNNNNNSTSSTPAAKISRPSNGNGGGGVTPQLPSALTTTVTSSSGPSPFSTPKFVSQIQSSAHTLPVPTSTVPESITRTPNVGTNQQNSATTPADNSPKDGLTSFSKALITPTSAVQAPMVDSKEVVLTTSIVPIPTANHSIGLKKEQELVVAAPVFREERYLKFYNAELTAHRRNWSSEGYALEARKYAERNSKQSANLALVDNDINSVRSLLKTAEVRCLLLNQKLQFVRDQICSLEAKSHSM